MYLKFKIDNETDKWKIYECKNYTHEKIKMSEIIDFLLGMKDKDNHTESIAFPHWLIAADIIIIPKIDEHLQDGNRTITDKDVHLLNMNCMLFTISTTFDTIPIYVLTTNQVFVESDKGQTIGRFNPNSLK